MGDKRIMEERSGVFLVKFKQKLFGEKYYHEGSILLYGREERSILAMIRDAFDGFGVIDVQSIEKLD